MPLDVQRLRDSDLAADESPESCWTAVLLWCVAWHQVPAASIPDDDEWIAKRARYWHRGKIEKEWEHVRKGALRGWIKCSDGRLYHPVVAEKAVDAWKAKHEQRYRTECARIKKHNQRHGTAIPYPTFDEFVSPQYKCAVPRDIPQESPGTKVICPEGQGTSVPGDNNPMSPGCPDENQSKGQGEGQGQDKGKQPPIPPLQGGKRVVDNVAAVIPLPLDGSGPEETGAGKPARRANAVSLKTFLAERKAKGEKAIPDDDPVFAYAEQVGIPLEFLNLQWREFRERYTEKGSKRYIDWRRHFRNSVRGNWFHLWFLKADGTCALTTQGEQARRRHDRGAA